MLKSTELCWLDRWLVGNKNGVGWHVLTAFQMCVALLAVQRSWRMLLSAKTLSSWCMLLSAKTLRSWYMLLSTENLAYDVCCYPQGHVAHDVCCYLQRQLITYVTICRELLCLIKWEDKTATQWYNYCRVVLGATRTASTSPKFHISRVRYTLSSIYPKFHI